MNPTELDHRIIDLIQGKVEPRNQAERTLRRAYTYALGGLNIMDAQKRVGFFSLDDDEQISFLVGYAVGQEVNKIAEFRGGGDA
jgi:hypothetical protein